MIKQLCGDIAILCDLLSPCHYVTILSTPSHCDVNFEWPHGKEDRVHKLCKISENLMFWLIINSPILY